MPSASSKCLGSVMKLAVAVPARPWMSRWIESRRTSRLIASRNFGSERVGYSVSCWSSASTSVQGSVALRMMNSMLPLGAKSVAAAGFQVLPIKRRTRRLR
ncbi:hypothetical protein ASE63_23750 [Bosea sp. Root381]|nr:hypothetical protein ASE63_23750 [Bosea sp. Root381]